MKKFSHVILILIITLVLALSGCDGGSSGGTDGTTYAPGQASTCTVGVSFKMRYVPGGSFTSDDDAISGDTDLPGPVNVANAYWIAETEVTWELWAAVYTWATDAARGANQYHFQNAGLMGDGDGDTNQHPVTTVSWRDVMIWCNALTEYYNATNGTNYACVYCTDADYAAPIRSVDDGSVDTAAGHEDNPYVNPNARGFRLPTSDEWELGGRYKDGSTWTTGNYASGATAGYKDEAATQAVAWYSDNSDFSTHPVGQKNTNALNLRDMSGNVYEWCFDWYPGYIGFYRMIRGGGWGDGASRSQLGFVDYDSPYGVSTGSVGFRPARTQ